MQLRTKYCREIKSSQDNQLDAVRRLYESTLDRAERIPWRWIERGLGRRPLSRRFHLLVAGQTAALGYCYGAFLSGYGGYVSYVGVAPEARGRGVGRRLYHAAFRRFRRDARRRDEPLPFVVWESRRPAAGDPLAVFANWHARLRLFDRVGGLWLSGATVAVPNYMDDGQPPVDLELFVRPVDQHEFDEVQLRAVIDGLAARIYGVTTGEAPTGALRLRPIATMG